MKSSSVFARVAASLLAIKSLLVRRIKVHSIHILETHSSGLPACKQLRSEQGRGDSDPGHCIEKGKK
jgi:hypothetical protein